MIEANVRNGVVYELDHNHDRKIPTRHRVKVDGLRTENHYTAIGPDGRIDPDVGTYAEAVMACRRASRAPRPKRTLPTWTPEQREIAARAREGVIRLIPVESVRLRSVECMHHKRWFDDDVQQWVCRGCHARAGLDLVWRPVEGPAIGFDVEWSNPEPDPEDFRVWKIRPDILLVAQVVGGLVLVVIVGICALAARIAFLRAVL